MKYVLSINFQVVSQPLPANKLSFIKHNRNQRGVWDYLRKKAISWKAEVGEWKDELRGVIGPPDPKLFEDPNEQPWVDPLASWEIQNLNQPETGTLQEVSVKTVNNCDCSKSSQQANFTASVIRMDEQFPTSLQRNITVNSTISEKFTPTPATTTTTVDVGSGDGSSTPSKSTS